MLKTLTQLCFNFTMFIIKQVPQDFIVKEVSNIKLDNKKRFSYFILKKENLSTPEALKIISTKLNIPLKKISFAGLKDKRAITQQLISINKITKKELNLKNLSTKFIGFNSKPISKGQLEKNQFIITVRNLKKEKEPIKFIENYFDEQRFSKNNAIIGKLILKRKYQDASKILMKDIRKINKNLLKFYIDSYQSFLFNELLKTKIKKPFFEIPYSLGKFRFSNKKIKEKELAIINFDTKENHYNKILKKEGIKKSNFLIKEFPALVSETTYRKTIIELKIDSKTDKDELNKGKIKQILKFELPKGSYATIVIKKMFS